MVEVHVMEHGLLLLQGHGIYRLNDSWYPIQAGDAVDGAVLPLMVRRRGQDAGVLFYIRT
ncbi:MAG: hypothetical protein R2851_15010 [Caldilineaceae bacterium]